MSGDKKLLALEDTCSQYTKPCVLDAKVRPWVVLGLNPA